jgi:hypothetical protein
LNPADRSYGAALGDRPFARRPDRHYGAGEVSNKRTLELAKELLDRFFRDAEGRTNRQLDVYFTLEDMSASRDKAEPALEYLASRGLLNTFGPDIAFLTDEGCRVAAEDLDLGSIPRVVRDFEQVSQTEPLPRDADLPEGPSTEARVRPDRPLLTHVSEDGAERVIELEWVCTMGRADDNDVRIDDKRASKHHAELRYEDDRYVLHDLESANGTLLNGEYVLEPCPVSNDDEIVIGRTLLLFQCPEVVPRPAGAPPEAAPPLRESTPAPDVGYVEREGFGEPTPIPPSIPVFAGRPETPGPEPEAAPPPEEPPTWSPPPADASPVPAADVPSAPAEEEPAFLDPDALMPLDAEEEVRVTPDAADPADAGHPEAAPEAFADTVRSLPSDEPAEAATIMTTRAALFGTGGVPSPTGDETGGPHAPDGRAEPPPEPVGVDGGAPPEATRADQTTDPGFRVDMEPALLTLLGHVRESLGSRTDMPDRDRLLAAVDLLREHPEVARLARAIEDEFGDV